MEEQKRVGDQVREARERPSNTAVSDLLGDRGSSVGLGEAGAVKSNSAGLGWLG